MTTTLEGNRAGETYNAKRDKVGRREGKVRMKSGDCEYLKADAKLELRSGLFIGGNWGRSDGIQQATIGGVAFPIYVRHDKITEHLNSGWQMANDLQYTHHGNYSVIMVWTGKGVPK